MENARRTRLEPPFNLADAGAFAGECRGKTWRPTAVNRVVVNHKSVHWLRQATGLALAGKRRSYGQLLKWLGGQRWYYAPEPGDSFDRRLWRIRAALLDAFAYEPEQP